MIYYGYVAIWEQGLNFGYSINLVDLIGQIGLVGLAGQDSMKVGMITDINAFKSIIDSETIIKKENSFMIEGEKTFYYDIEEIFQQLCKHLKAVEPTNLYSGYIEHNSAQYEFNNEETKKVSL